MITSKQNNSLASEDLFPWNIEDYVILKNYISGYVIV